MFDPLRTPPLRGPALRGAEVSQHAHALHRGFSELFGLYGYAADGPRPGETDVQYARRGLDSAKRYSPTWCHVEFDRVSADALPVAYEQIVTEGVREFKKPAGPLREVVTRDRAGREIVEFYGDREDCWRPFKQQPRLARFAANLGRGPNSPQAKANAPVAVVLGDGTIAPTQAGRERGVTAESLAATAAVPDRPRGGGLISRIVGAVRGE